MNVTHNTPQLSGIVSRRCTPDPGSQCAARTSCTPYCCRATICACCEVRSMHVAPHRIPKANPPRLSSTQSCPHHSLCISTTELASICPGNRVIVFAACMSSVCRHYYSVNNSTNTYSYPLPGNVANSHVLCCAVSLS